MEKAIDATAVEREIEIAASPETVWEFLVDPDKVLSWMGQTASFDARPGGSYRLAILPGHTVTGEFLELDPPRRLVYTWGWEPGADGPNPVPPGSTIVEIELSPAGVGTLLRFTHRGLPNADAIGSHTHGWMHYYARLAIVAAGGDPGRDPWLDA